MAGFRFVDDTDAQKMLAVDRLTFQELLATGRLRAVSRTGTIQFFRAGDIARLRDELAAEATAAAAASAPQEDPPKKTKKAQDPAMRVHTRLTADLKWYDISDADIGVWFDQLHPDTYARRRGVAQFVRERMEHIIALLDAGEARYRSLMEGQEAGGGGNAAQERREDQDREGLQDQIEGEAQNDTGQ